MSQVTNVGARKIGPYDFTLVFDYQAAAQRYVVFENGSERVGLGVPETYQIVNESGTDKVMTQVTGLNYNTAYTYTVAAVLGGQKDTASTSLAVTTLIPIGLVTATDLGGGRIGMDVSASIAVTSLTVNANTAGQYNLTLPTYNSGDETELQTDNRGRLYANISNPTLTVTIPGLSLTPGANQNVSIINCTVTVPVNIVSSDATLTVYVSNATTSDVTIAGASVTLNTMIVNQTLTVTGIISGTDNVTIIGASVTLNTAVTSIPTITVGNFPTTFKVSITDAPFTVPVLDTLKVASCVTIVSSSTLNTNLLSSSITLNVAVVSGAGSPYISIINCTYTLPVNVASIPTITVSNFPTTFNVAIVNATFTVPVSVASIPTVTIGNSINVTVLNNTLTIQGDTGSGMTDVGYPVKISGVYNATLTAYGTGIRIDAQSDAYGHLKITGSSPDAVTDSVGNPIKIGAIYNLATVTYATGQRTTAQSDINGNIKVKTVSGSTTKLDDGVDTAQITASGQLLTSQGRLSGENISDDSIAVNFNKITPNIYNVICTATATIYSQALPVFCKGFDIKLRETSGALKISFNSGLATYFTIPSNSVFTETSCALATATLYFQSDTASVNAEILAWS